MIETTPVKMCSRTRGAALRDKLVLAYTDPASEAYHAPLKAMLAAGYTPATAKTMSGIVLRRPDVQLAIAKREHLAEQRKALQDQVTVELVRAAHVDLMDKAKARGDWSEARLNLEDLGKTVGAYKDSVTLEPAQVQALSEREHSEALRIAAIMLGQGQGSIDAECVPAQLPAPSVDQAQSMDKADADACHAALYEPSVAWEQVKLELGLDSPGTALQPVCGQSDSPADADAGAGEIVAETCPAAIPGDPDTPNHAGGSENDTSVSHVATAEAISEKSESKVPPVIVPPSLTWSNGKPR